MKSEFTTALHSGIISDNAQGPYGMQEINPCWVHAKQETSPLYYSFGPEYMFTDTKLKRG